MAFSGGPFAGASFGGESLGGSADLADSFTASGVFAGDVLYNLISQVNATGSVQGNFTLVGNVADSVRATDTLSAAWQLLVAESMATTGEALGTVTKLAALIDALVATGQASNNLTAFTACVDAMTLEGLIRLGFDPDLVDALTLSEAITTNTRLLATALDSVSASDTFDTFLRISVIAADSTTLTNGAETILRANADLADQLLVYVSLRIGGTDYVGFALNTDAKAASRHSNSQHDSYASFKKKHYAAGPDGIVEFTGEDDDGNAIPWSLTSFLLDFGSSKHKRNPDAFIGATSDGQLVMQVVTRDPHTGVQSEDWYLVARLPANGPGEGRVQIGRGLSSTWWQYRLTSVQGASLALDKIELKPIILDRRT